MMNFLVRSKKEEVKQIKTAAFINTIILHDNLIVCGMVNGRIKIWDMNASGSLESTPPKVLEGHTKSVYSMSARENRLVSASGGADKTIRVWDLDAYAQIHSISYENALPCLKMELTKSQLILWYMSESRRSRGELVMFSYPEAEGDLTRLAYEQNAVFNEDARQNRVKLGDVSEQFSAVAYPTQIILFENREKEFFRIREMKLKENQWVYLMTVFRKMLLTVFREGEETLHGLIDDVVNVHDIRSNTVAYSLNWKWTLFSPLKSAFMTPFGIVATNTSERAFTWHWEDLPENFQKVPCSFDVAPKGQSSYVMQWRHRINAAMNVRGVALVNEQRSHVYLLQY